MKNPERLLALLLLIVMAVTALGGVGGSTHQASLYQGVITSSSPTVPSGTSTTILAARSPGWVYIEIQNNTNSAIAISISGATLTSVTTGAGNACIVIPPGAEWHSAPNFAPLGPITCYQSSGSSTNSIFVGAG